MAGIDPSRPFTPVRIAVLTVSDTRSREQDRSGQLLVDRIEAAGHALIDRQIVPDDKASIVAILRTWITDPHVQVVIATGGTGLTGRDVTPEAFQEVLDKEIPGFGELFRMLSYTTVGTSTMQSRALGGVASGTYLFALPGSTSACREAWDNILGLQLDSRYTPCNLVDLLPRLQEHGPSGSL
jgi:molybdenum cofactor biosynthesis protein B